ncbi:hypothetical protein AB0942_21355 [Streptomyces nodosus]
MTSPGGIVKGVPAALTGDFLAVVEPLIKAFDITHKNTRNRS